MLEQFLFFRQYESWRLPLIASDIHASFPGRVQATWMFHAGSLAVPGGLAGGAEAHDQHGGRVPSTM